MVSREIPHFIPEMTISVILSVSFQVAKLDVEHRFPGVEYMVLSVMDENEVDLVTHFERCFEFIDRGRAAGERLSSCIT